MYICININSRVTELHHTLRSIKESTRRSDKKNKNKNRKMKTTPKPLKKNLKGYQVSQRLSVITLQPRNRKQKHNQGHLTHSAEPQLAIKLYVMMQPGPDPRPPETPEVWKHGGTSRWTCGPGEEGETG